MGNPLILTAAVLVLAGGAVVALVAARRPRTEQGSHLVPQRAAQAGPQPEPEPPDASPLVTHLLDRAGLARQLQWRLLKAGLLLKPTELVVLVAGIAGAGYVVGLFLHGPLIAIALAIAGAMLPFSYMNMRVARRSKLMAAQLPEALGMMASSMRSGYSFMRAMQVVSQEMDPPISQEFGRVLDELGVGLSQERALQHLHDRCPNNDIELVVTACQIQANVGGNLAEILETTADMIRERARLQGEIAALTAEGKLSAYILIGLPIGLAVVVSRMSPGYLDPLYQTHQGLQLLALAIGAMMVGVLIIKKMLSVDL